MVAIAIGLAVSGVASAASGEAKPELYRGFYAELGGFYPLDVTTRLDINIPGFDLVQEIDLPQALDSSERVDRGRFRGGYRFNRRHEIEFSYVSVNRGNMRSFEESFEFMGMDFTAGVDFQTMLRTVDVELGYKYFIVVHPRGEFGFSFGLHGVLTEFGVDAEAFVTRSFEDLIDLSFSERDTLEVPLPYLGLFFELKLGKKFYFGALGKILDVEIDNYSGHWTTFELNLEHWTFKHVGFGVGYYSYSLDVTKNNVRGIRISGIDMEQDGFQGYLRLNI